MTSEEYEALKEVRRYLADEKGDYNSQAEPEDHIFLSIQKLERFIGKSR